MFDDIRFSICMEKIVAPSKQYTMIIYRDLKTNDKK